VVQYLPSAQGPGFNSQCSSGVGWGRVVGLRCLISRLDAGFHKLPLNLASCIVVDSLLTNLPTLLTLIRER
jgi:hypothetical protein